MEMIISIVIKREKKLDTINGNLDLNRRDEIGNYRNIADFFQNLKTKVYWWLEEKSMKPA